jgi:DNA polymerase I-like protein with 3'-5' exonuclease and polymerase domains
MMLAKLRKHKPELAYGKCKDTNFAKLFAAGPSKLGLMLEFVTQAQYEQLKAAKANRRHPWLKEVAEILKIYDAEVPEVDKLTKEYTHDAETRGFIRSILGRRMRFPNGMRSHKALNGRIIMSEADIVKTKAVELHRARKVTGFKMRFQVHDEYDGDVPDNEAGKRTSAILNHQSFPSLRVKILWGGKVADNWGACAAGELKKMREEALL